jgi:hypothetical protein
LPPFLKQQGDVEMEDKKMLKVYVKNTTHYVGSEVVGNRTEEMVEKNGTNVVTVKAGMTGGRIVGTLGGRPITFRHLQKKGEGKVPRDIYKTTQILAGEDFEVEINEEDWNLIKKGFERYASVGWINLKVDEISDDSETFKKLVEAETAEVVEEPKKEVKRGRRKKAE